MNKTSWLTIARGDTPLLVSLPHAGTDLVGLEGRLVSPWRAREDADWWIDRLYDFAADIGATVVRTSISRTVIDVNRDPSGASLYPGQATTGLCPITTFDGEPLYVEGKQPRAAEIAERKATYFDLYHIALSKEIARLRTSHEVVALYDCHSIRSVIPTLFAGELPEFSLGTNGAASADADLIGVIVERLRASGRSHVVDGRFKGGWITRSFGAPARGVHAVQMEIACRAYVREPIGAVSEADWPPSYDLDFARPARDMLHGVLIAVRDWARRASESRRQLKGQP